MRHWRTIGNSNVATRTGSTYVSKNDSVEIPTIVREYVFTFFSKFKKRDFLRFLKCHVKKT